MPDTSILMIDDNPFFALHVQGMCTRSQGWSAGEWMSATTAVEGVALAASRRPALILLSPTMHADEAGLETHCRELAAAVAPSSTSLLFLHTPLQQFDGVLARLANCSNLALDALTKPFTQPDFDAKVERLLLLADALPAFTPPPVSPAPVPRYAWLSSAPEVAGHAHIAVDGSVLEWSGAPEDEMCHGALIYILNLASLCGEELGFGAAAELQAVGRDGSALTLALGQGTVLNVLATPRANLRAFSTRALEPAA